MRTRNLNRLLGSSAVLLVASVVMSISVVASVSNIKFQSFIPTTTAVTFCIGTSDPCQFEAGFVTGAVRMVCFDDAQWTDAQSHRWFYVQAPDGTEGFVHASAVLSQTGTPSCDNIPWIKATAWALAQDGHTDVPSYSTNGNTTMYWTSRPWLFCYDAWRFGAGHEPIYDAQQAQLVWNRYHERGLTRSPSNMPPRGSLVFFSHGTMGYVAISLGLGWVEGTQGDVESQRMPVIHMQITKLAQAGMSMLGYVPLP